MVTRFSLGELIGQQYGQWTVIGPVRISKWNEQKVLCRCVCGATAWRSNNQLMGFPHGCYQCTRRMTRKENRPYFSAAGRNGEKS